MFDFGVFIAIVIAIIGAFFPIYFTLNKEIQDLLIQPQRTEEINLKIRTRKKIKIKLIIITTFLFLLILILFFLPNITTVFENFTPLSLSDVGNFLYKFVPFKEGFLSDANIRFSYITESILAIIFLFFCFWFLKDIIDPDCFRDYIIVLIILIIIIYGLLWLNYGLSKFLAYCIIHCFEFLSIFINLACYIVFSFMLGFIDDEFF